MLWRSALALVTLLALAPPAASAGEPEKFTEARLLELLRENPATGRPVDSMRELVPLLPDELRRNFALVYKSRSPFHAEISPQYPRVILFTDDARLVLTFIGDERHDGADLLETMSFDDSTAKFELRARLLPAAERRAWRPSPDAKNCARCHGADPRPIYDAYPLWPGYYGSVLDTFPRDRLGTKEASDFAAFTAKTAKAGVYKDLLYPTGSPVSPFLDPKLLKANTVELDSTLLPYLPSARLGMALTELNRKRIYRKLAAGPAFAAREKEMLAMLLECRESDRPDPRAVRSIEGQLVRENVARLKRQGLVPGDVVTIHSQMSELLFPRELAEIDWVARRAGVDRSDWSMAMERNSLAFFDGILSGIYDGKSYYLKEDLIFELLSHLAEREPVFRDYFAPENVFAMYDYPFGRRINLGKAAMSCPLLTTSPRSVDASRAPAPRRHS
jgi:hypothetical protein